MNENYINGTKFEATEYNISAASERTDFIPAQSLDEHEQTTQ